MNKPPHGGARKGAGRKATGRTKVNLTVSIEPDAKARIDAKAARDGVSASSLVERWAMRLPKAEP